MKIRNESGQAMVETVLTMPLLIFVLLNATNFGYLFISIINMTAGTRTGAEFAIMGSANTISQSLPAAGNATNLKSVAYLVYEDIRSGMANPSQLAAVMVCTPANGYQSLNPPTKIAKCQTYGNVPPGYTPPLLSGNGTDNDFDCPGALPNCPEISFGRLVTRSPLLFIARQKAVPSGQGTDGQNFCLDVERTGKRGDQEPLLARFSRNT